MSDARSDQPSIDAPVLSAPGQRRSWRIRCLRDAAILSYTVLLASACAIAFAAFRIEQLRASKEPDPLPMFAIMFGFPLGTGAAILLALAVLGLLIASRFRFRLLHVILFFAASGVALAPMSRAALWVAAHATHPAGAPLTSVDLTVEGYLPTALPRMYGSPGHGHWHNSYVTFRLDFVAVAFVVPVLALMATFPTALSALFVRFWSWRYPSGR